MVLMQNVAVFLVGSLFAMQAVLNTKLATYLNHPLQSSLVNFLVGTLILLALNIALKTPLPDLSQIKNIPWYLIFGGFIGTVVVSSAIFLLPHVGVTFFLFGLIAGQLITSMFLEHHGTLGVTMKAFTWKRGLATGFILIGFFMMSLPSKHSGE